MKTIAVSLLLLCVMVAHAAPKTLAQGPFGKALDARHATLAVCGRPEYAIAPLTVECWAKLQSKDKFNILVAQDPKTSPAHWEIYSCAGSGAFSAYMPGLDPSEIKSTREMADNHWHYLAMLYETNRVRLYVDAQLVADQSVQRRSDAPGETADLRIGGIAKEPSLRCDGLIGEVRVSQGLRQIDSVPGRPFESDGQTVGLWRMDKINASQIDDQSTLVNPARLLLDSPKAKELPISMDALDWKSFNAGPAPTDSKAAEINLENGPTDVSGAPATILLDGDWDMAEGGDETQRLAGAWPDRISAKVPGSVHSALVAAGRIPDPKFGRNDAIAHEKSFQTWWFRRSFPRPFGGQRSVAANAGESTERFPPVRLVFHGVAIHCAVWLNGRPLGTHEGMFGGPEFDISRLLKDQNTLVVKIDPAPGDPKAWNNPDWRKTVAFNCVWGWHYSSIPPLGIWRSVIIESTPTIQIEHPFVTTRDARRGLVDLVTELRGPLAGWSGTLRGVIAPENFNGSAHHFIFPLKASSAKEEIHLRFQIPQARLWWPNDLGEPNLYRLTLSFIPENGGAGDCRETTFGVRTIKMAPLPGGPRSSQFNWTFVVNERPIFVKGSGWCTMDSSMDFSRPRYDRFLALAKMQHLQMLRCWGSGMPETDDFYDLCDRKGIMVMQEWPTAWDSHLVQPVQALEETVRLNTLRLRNHPSLALYGGGNESANPFGKSIDLMGRYAIELDGSRPFHRGEPWGGSAHNYDCYWGRQPLDHNLTMTAPFWGEFGLASMPDYESVLRYLPENEKNIWPPPADGSLIHHTPVFGSSEDWSRLSQYASYFVEPCDMKTFIVGSQLAQAVGVRHTLERARTRWPDCSGALYYKLNDNYPGASWSSADWYGAPKIGHYVFQNAFAPLHACVLFDTLNDQGKPVSWPVFLLDDAAALKNTKWEVRVRAFDRRLQQIKSETFAGRGSVRAPKQLGSFALTAKETDSTPLLVVSEIRTNSILADRAFYFLNYEAERGSLFKLPRTQISLRPEASANDATTSGLVKEPLLHKIVIRNQGSFPAVAVALLRPGHLDTFTADDNYFWLDPGESKTVRATEADELTVEAWNRGMSN